MDALHERSAQCGRYAGQRTLACKHPEDAAARGELGKIRIARTAVRKFRVPAHDVRCSSAPLTVPTAPVAAGLRYVPFDPAESDRSQPSSRSPNRKQGGAFDSAPRWAGWVREPRGGTNRQWIGGCAKSVSEWRYRNRVDPGRRFGHPRHIGTSAWPAVQVIARTQAVSLAAALASAVVCAARYWADPEWSLHAIQVPVLRRAGALRRWPSRKGAVPCAHDRTRLRSRPPRSPARKGPTQGHVHASRNPSQ